MMPPVITVGSRPGLLEDPGDHRGGGRLAVRAGDADGRKFSIIRASMSARLQTVTPAALRRDQFRIGLLDGGGQHDEPRALDILRAMADRDRNPLGGEAADVDAVLEVAAAHRDPPIVQHLGDRAHTDAADPDDVDRLEFRQILHRACPWAAFCAAKILRCLRKRNNQIGQTYHGVEARQGF